MPSMGRRPLVSGYLTVCKSCEKRMYHVPRLAGYCWLCAKARGIV